MSLPLVLQNVQKILVKEAKEKKNIPSFRAGDTIAIKTRVLDGASERVTTFQGVCIKKKNAGILSSLTLRKITAGLGVEKTIPIYSPLTVSLEVVKKGKVRRATLNYLRKRPGAIKIKERFVSKKIKS